jgi:hypothetical protein
MSMTKEEALIEVGEISNEADQSLAPLTIEEAAAEIKHVLGALWLGTIYCEQILILRTRAAQVRPAARNE